MLNRKMCWPSRFGTRSGQGVPERPLCRASSWQMRTETSVSALVAELILLLLSFHHAAYHTYYGYYKCRTQTYEILNFLGDPNY